ncbi:MAG: outer membrane beta-barrel protein [bacterium]|nr:outer membrane beta-barrel protein [bacterium]
MVILSKHNNTLSGIAQTSLQTLSIAKNITGYAVSIMVLLVLSLSSRADTVITDMPVCRQPVAIVPSDSTSNMAASPVKPRLSLRLGYSIGGTIPIDFPAEMRALNSYSPKVNYQFGIDYERMLTDKYGLQLGLYLERRGFKSEVEMRHYDITLEQGGEKIKGPFSGNVVIEIVQIGVTIPVQATWHPDERWTLRLGPYVSYIHDRSFQGYAYGKKVYDADGKWTGSFDAYIRRDEIRGEKVEIGDIYKDEAGNVVDKRGTFSGEDYNSYLRRLQYGVDMGAEFKINRSWGAYADFSFGLNSAFNGKEGNPVSMALHPTYLTVGLTYRLR